MSWRCSITIIAGALVSCISCGSLVGAVIVVNREHPAASDTNSGSPTRPLKTISAATSKLHAGDKVIVYGGEYRETVIVKASGTSEAPIIIEAAAGTTPVIKGSDVIRHWARESASIWKAKMPQVPERSGDSSDPSFWGTTDIRQIFVRDGKDLDAIRLRPIKTKDKLGPGSFYCDVAKHEVFIWMEAGTDPNKITVEAATRGAWLYVLGSHVAVRGFQMRHSSTLGIANWPACVLQGEGLTLEKCYLSWSDFVGVSLSGKNNSLLGCTIACHGNCGIGGTGEGHVIEGCRIVHNNLDRYSPAWHGGGAKLVPQFNRGRIAGNEFAYNVGPGLWLDGDCEDNLIECNSCHDNEGAGIMVEISSGNQLINNIATGNRNPLAGTYLIPDPIAVKAHQNNVFSTQRINDRSQSSLIYTSGDGLGILISSSPRSRVLNNTCYLNEGGGITVEGGLRSEAGPPMSTRECSVENNIMVYNKGCQLILRKNGLDPHTSGNMSDHNLLLSWGGIFARNGWAGESASSLAEWQHLSGQDIHSREGDPNFALSATHDFRLQTGSPALANANPLPEVRTDFYGNKRPQDKPSIGACEITGMDYPRSSDRRLE